MAIDPQPNTAYDVRLHLAWINDGQVVSSLWTAELRDPNGTQIGSAVTGASVAETTNKLAALLVEHLTAHTPTED